MGACVMAQGAAPSKENRSFAGPLRDQRPLFRHLPRPRLNGDGGEQDRRDQILEPQSHRIPTPGT
jgi:hypothetical protein